MKTPWWFMHKNPVSFLLLPVGVMYYIIGRIVWLWRRMFAMSSRRPIVCVGNILAGGVGKTPVVRAIANYFDAPVVMRGYKKSAQTGNAGDEATMMSRDGLQVHTGDRKSNIILLNRQKGDRRPIIMDDGMQNPSIKKNVKIAVFDEGIGYGNGFLLPAGPLREPKRAARRADAIIVIRANRPRKDFVLPRGVPVFYAENETLNPYEGNEKLVAFAGIGFPKKFFASLPNIVATRAFADHYQYTFADLDSLFALAKKKGAKLVTTEKDWVRLPDGVRDKIKYAKLVTKIDDAFFKWLGDKIK